MIEYARDLPERLRAAAMALPSGNATADTGSDWIPSNVCTDAADEIEKLRRTISVLGNMWTTSVSKDAVMVILRPNTMSVPDGAIEAIRENVKRWSELRPDLPQVLLLPGCVSVEASGIVLDDETRRKYCGY